MEVEESEKTLLKEKYDILKNKFMFYTLIACIIVRVCLNTILGTSVIGTIVMVVLGFFCLFICYFAIKNDKIVLSQYLLMTTAIVVCIAMTMAEPHLRTLLIFYLLSSFAQLFMEKGVIVYTNIMNILFFMYCFFGMRFMFGTTAQTIDIVFYTVYFAIMAIVSILSTIIGDVMLSDIVNTQQKTIKEQAKNLEMLNNVDSSNKTLNSIKSNLGKSIDNSSENLSKMANEIESICAFMEQQAASVQTIFTETELASNDVNSSMLSVQEINKSVIQTKIKTNSSVEIIIKLTGYMSSVKDQINNIIEKYKIAEIHNNKIKEYLGKISEISSKTNLLAFNAQIESARAGELGRGFSVVANEIKILSDSTSKFTKDIETLVEVKTKTDEEVTKAIIKENELIVIANNELNNINTELNLINDNVELIDKMAGNADSLITKVGDIFKLTLVELDEIKCGHESSTYSISDVVSRTREQETEMNLIKDQYDSVSNVIENVNSFFKNV